MTTEERVRKAISMLNLCIALAARHDGEINVLMGLSSDLSKRYEQASKPCLKTKTEEIMMLIVAFLFLNIRIAQTKDPFERASLIAIFRGLRNLATILISALEPTEPTSEERVPGINRQFTGWMKEDLKAACPKWWVRSEA